MKRKQLNKKEIKTLQKELSKNYPTYSLESKNIEIEDNVLKVNGEKAFFKHEKWVPTLHLILKNNFLPTITVDMGTVPFLIKGADIMRPGITKIEEFAKKDIVAIIDERNKKPLAIGEAMFNSEEIEKMNKGKVVKMLHYIGDKTWVNN